MSPTVMALTSGHLNFFLPLIKAQSNGSEVKNSQLRQWSGYSPAVSSVCNASTHMYSPRSACMNRLKATVDNCQQRT